MSTKILIVEDHALLADGIVRLLENQTRYQIVGIISDGLDVYSACLRLSPDLILLDLNLPGMDGTDVIHLIRKRWINIRIVVVTSSTEEHRCLSTLKAGAQSYVLKRSPPHVLLAALQCAEHSQTYIDPTLKLDSMGSETREERPQLTPRERQVLKLVSEGKRNRDISENLSISLKTVETHRLNLMRKLDAHNSAELVNWARRIGIA